MPELDQLFAPSQRRVAGSGAVWDATVRDDTNPDGAMVSIDVYSPGLLWGPCLPQDLIPEVGSRVAVTIADSGELWIVGASPPAVDDTPTTPVDAPAMRVNMAPVSVSVPVPSTTGVIVVPFDTVAWSQGGLTLMPNGGVKVPSDGLYRVTAMVLLSADVNTGRLDLILVNTTTYSGADAADAGADGIGIDAGLYTAAGKILVFELNGGFQSGKGAIDCTKRAFDSKCYFSIGAVHIPGAREAESCDNHRLHYKLSYFHSHLFRSY